MGVGVEGVVWLKHYKISSLLIGPREYLATAL